MIFRKRLENDYYNELKETSNNFKINNRRSRKLYRK